MLARDLIKEQWFIWKDPKDNAGVELICSTGEIQEVNGKPHILAHSVRGVPKTPDRYVPADDEVKLYEK